MEQRNHADTHGAYRRQVVKAVALGWWRVVREHALFDICLAVALLAVVYLLKGGHAEARAIASFKLWVIAIGVVGMMLLVWETVDAPARLLARESTEDASNETLELSDVENSEIRNTGFAHIRMSNCRNVLVSDVSTGPKDTTKESDETT